MKTIEELLSELRLLDIRVWSEGDSLRYHDPKEALTSSLLTQMRERKEEILTFMHRASTAFKTAPPPIVPTLRDNIVPLSFAQQRLWFLNQLEPSSFAYSMPTAYRIHGRMNISALEKSISEVLRRHQILRTTFRSLQGQPYQVIAPEIPLQLQPINLTKLTSDKQVFEVKKQVTREAQKPFNLVEGPLFRVKLLCLSEAEYILLINMHHIVSDGWSYGILFDELKILYEAFSSGQPSPLSELPIQYADYSVWQRQWLQGKVLETHLDYWQQKLGSNPPVLQLPTDYTRPLVQTNQGASQNITLPKKLSDSLKFLSQQSNTTIFITLLTAFQILLHRLTGQEGISIGSPIAGRNQFQIERLIGFFVNTIVLCTEISGDQSFLELLNSVREVALEAYAHQDLPFEKLVEELQPERHTSHSPLFQVMFSFQTHPDLTLELPGLTVQYLEAEHVTAKFDLTLTFADSERELKGAFEYNTDLFSTVTISRMQGQFKTLLSGIVANPEKRISELSLLTPDEQCQLLNEWNDTQTDYPKNICIHQLFEAQVRRSPNAIAVIFDQEQITYRALNERANQLAHYLIKLGVGTESLVGICIERSLEMIVGIFGILKAGAAYVPLDPVYPKEYLELIVSDAQLPVILTQRSLIDSLPVHKAHLVYLDSSDKSIFEKEKSNPTTNVTVNNLAYVIYTSGSTGQPKGVLGLHRGAINRFYWMWKSFPFEKQEICCQKTSLSFVDSVWEIFGPLLQNVPLVIISDSDFKDPLQLISILANKEVTRIVLVPSLLRLLLKFFPNLQNKLPRLKYWIVSGETLELSLAQNFQRAMSDNSLLVNLYGSSEVSGDVTWFNINKRNVLQQVFIGRPLANTKVYVLDKYLQPVPVGVTGELYISGENLARGYLNHPIFTAENFIPDPFSPQLGTRMYKTGDLACYFSNGNIRFIGRKDYQVKVRGFRIEVGQIEAMINQHPNVDQAAVVAREKESKDKSLIAYVVLKHEKNTTNELRYFLKQKIPEYMIPTTFVEVEALPMLPNGKLDRKRLPEPSSFQKNFDSNFLAPRDTIEKDLTRIWEVILEVSPIGVRDNFFSLGGHSILAVQLMAQVQQQFGINLALVTLFQSPTIEQLANEITELANSRPTISTDSSNNISTITNKYLFKPFEYNPIKFLQKIRRKVKSISHTFLLEKLLYYRNFFRSFSSNSSSLLEIQTGSSKYPLFFVPGSVGTAFYLYHLAQNMGSEQTFYGLQSVGIDGKSRPLTRVEDMAAHFIREIKAVQPQGPYFIGGHSFGGLVAFEIAQQAQRKGDEVALLAIIDTIAPIYTSKITNSEWDDTKVIAFFTNVVESWTGKQIGVSYETLQTLNPDEQLEYFKECMKRVNLLLPTIGSKKILGVLQVLKASLNTLYCPKNKYKNKVTLFRGEDYLFYLNSDNKHIRHIVQDPSLGWNQLASKPVEIHFIPGDHVSIMAEPHVQLLAEKLKMCIDSCTK